MSLTHDGGGVPPIIEDLRQTSDQLLKTLEELGRLERAKRLLVPGDPEIIGMSARIAELAAQVLSGTVVQLKLSEEAQAQAEAGPLDGAAVSIEDTPRMVSLILEEWRDAERRIQDAAPGSSEWMNATSDSDRLRAEYRRAFDVREDEQSQAP